MWITMLHNGTGFRIQTWYKKSHLGIDLISLAPGRFEWNFGKYIFNLNLVIDGWGLFLLKFTIKWMSLHILLMKSQPCDTECVNICRGRTWQSSVSEEPYAMYNGNGIINRSCAPNGPTWALYLVRRLCPQRTVWGLSSWWAPIALLCWYPSFISIHYNSFEDWVPAGAGTRSSNELHWFEREEAAVFGCCCFNSFWKSQHRSGLSHVVNSMSHGDLVTQRAKASTEALLTKYAWIISGLCEQDSSKIRTTHLKVRHRWTIQIPGSDFWPRLLPIYMIWLTG